MEASTDIVIVGGGVIGCAIAYYLRKAGLLAPLGSLDGPGPLADFLLASYSMLPELVAELEEASGIAMEYERTGALRIVRDPKNIANLRKRMREWQPLGLEMQWLTGEEARQREPLLASDVCA